MTRVAEAADRVAALATAAGRAPQAVERSPELVQRLPHVIAKGARGQQRVDLDEIGTTGLRQYGGFVLEEWLRQLSGARAAWTYREMMDNDPVIGAILFAMEMLARNTEWSVKQGKDADSAEFVEQCMGDMAHTWDELVSEALSMLPYGWALHETVYKRRLGKQPELPMSIAEPQGAPQDVASSAYDDGRVGWRKIAVRAQETLLRWHFDQRGGVQAMEQVDWQGHYNTIPIAKALLFRPKARRGNPEGRSILRNAFVPWYRLKNIQEIEAIGIERDLAGLPVATPPPGVDLFAKHNADLLAQVQQLVTTIRRDEDEGVVLPQADWKLELMTTGGSRQIDTDAIVRRYEQRIASSVLADFILIGQDSVGSFAMVDVKSDLFGIALDTVLDMIAEVINRYAIPRLLGLNGLPLDDPPQVTHGSTGRVDLQRIAQFLELLSGAGAPIPWSRELIEALFTEANLPANFEETDSGLALPTGARQPAPAAGEDKQPGTEPAEPAAANGPKPGQGSGLPEWNMPGSVKPLAKAEASSGAMVALYPPPDVAQALCQDGGEPASDLHVTLAFLGPAGAIDDVDELRQAVALWAARTPPLTGEVSGTGKFTAGPAPVTYASADVPGLPEARQRLVDALDRTGAPASREHGFTPHITLAYADTDPQVANHRLLFDHATLKVGDTRHDFPLAGRKLAKADVSVPPGLPAGHALVVRLRQRAQQLEGRLRRDVSGVLKDVGSAAQLAYLAQVNKAGASQGASPSDRALVERTITALGLPAVAQRLRGVFRANSRRVLNDSLATINAQIGLQVNIPDPVARQIVADGGTRAGLIDLEGAVRQALYKAISDGRSNGEGPAQIARRIRDQVPAGPFPNAGSDYRAQLIARTETMNAQRLSTLAAYRAAPSVGQVQIHDGLLDGSDEECTARDGDIVDLDEADALAADEHPNGTMSFSPVVASPADDQAPAQPDAAAEPVPA